jgi:hypothetical protein
VKKKKGKYTQSEQYEFVQTRELCGESPVPWRLVARPSDRNPMLLEIKIFLFVMREADLPNCCGLSGVWDDNGSLAMRPEA